MKTHLVPIVAAMLAASAGVSAADASGYIRQNGRKTAVTAVYFHREANNAVIVFDDSAKATKAIERKSQGGYAMTDDGLSADTVFYDLANKGGHPIELTIMDDDAHTVIDLTMIEKRSKPARHFSTSSANVEIVRNDDDRIEGRLAYDDGKTTMSLPFALDKNRVGHAKALGANPPPPPPPPPPPSNPGAMLMMAADLLELEIGDYYKGHNGTWPSSIEQVHKQPWESPDPVAARKLGANGVLTIVFAPGAPYVGGKTVTFTPTVMPDGIEWKCSTKDALEACH